MYGTLPRFNGFSSFLWRRISRRNLPTRSTDLQMSQHRAIKRKSQYFSLASRSPEVAREEIETMFAPHFLSVLVVCIKVVISPIIITESLYLRLSWIFHGNWLFLNWYFLRPNKGRATPKYIGLLWIIFIFYPESWPLDQQVPSYPKLGAATRILLFKVDSVPKLTYPLPLTIHKVLL